MSKGLACEKVLNVVLIDDDEADNYIHRRNIHASKKGRVVKEFFGAREAIDWLSSEPNDIDIIFLDINMPEMDGFEFLKIYNELDSAYKAKTVVIMLTSSTMKKDIEQSDELGAKFETKPLTTQGFIDLIASIEVLN